MRHKSLVEIATAELTRRLEQGDADRRALIRAADIIEAMEPYLSYMNLSAKDTLALNMHCQYVAKERAAGRMPTRSKRSK
jgi:hypothetical protein